MSARLNYIEICNFKSFSSRTVVGPFKTFSAVVGPNGSGKSNMMDAICFALGENAVSLRVKKLSDLVHGADIGHPALNLESYVIAVFEVDPETELHLRRDIHADTSVYRINNSVVGAAVYMKQLQKLGIVVKARNFRIFQDQVQALVMADPKERTELFEHMSRSVEIKAEYDQTKKKLRLAENELNSLMQKKRMMYADKKSTKSEVDFVNKYNHLCSRLKEEMLKLHLFKLDQNEIAQSLITEEMKCYTEGVENAMKELHDSQNTLRIMKEKHGKLSLELADKNKTSKQMESTLVKKQVSLISMKEKISHSVTKLAQARKSYEAAKKALDYNRRDALELEVQEKDMIRRIENLKVQFETELQTKGEVQLPDVQVAEYHRLKKIAASRTGPYLVEVNSLTFQHKMFSDQLENEERRGSDLTGKINVIRQQMELHAQRISKLNAYIDSSKTELDELLKLKDNLSSEVTAAGSRIKELQTETDKILNELTEIKDWRAESGRYMRKNEVVEDLKRLFFGVHGRLKDFCHPIHSKYRIAVTHVMGKYLDAIVCDSHVTAKNCIRYLKDQSHGVETFLPLDYIKVKKLNERLREITEPKNVKLVFDVLSFDEPHVKPALIFACRDSLVCETVEDARTVAYGMEERHEAVSLDGILFHKSGTISGGVDALARKANCWDDKEFNRLKNRKLEISNELIHVSKVVRKESELRMIRSQIDSLTTRVKCATVDRGMITNNDMAEKEKQLVELQEQHCAIEKTVAELTMKMTKCSERMEALKNEMENDEDTVFAQFCLSIGVENIRIYEKNWLQLREEHQQKMLESENHLLRIQNQIQFEKSRSGYLEEDVDRCKSIVQNEEEKGERLKTDEQVLIHDLKAYTEEMESLKKSLTLLKAKTEKLYADMNLFCKGSLAEKQSSVDSFKKMLFALNSKLEQNKVEKNDLLKSFKFGHLSLSQVCGSSDDMQDPVSSDDDEEEEEEVTGASLSLSSEATLGISAKKVLKKIDFAYLGTYRNVTDRDTAKKLLEEIQENITSLEVQLERLPPVDLAASNRFSKVNSDCMKVEKEFKSFRTDLCKLRNAHENARKKRYSRFITCFDGVSSKVDGIYKLLTQNAGAQAILSLEDEEEPYLSGTCFNCVAPGKRFQATDNLSGGEKALAALSLLFALHSCSSVPFLILDEVDASLDSANILKVVNYIKSRSNMQCIIISHKKEFYNSAEALFGFYVRRSDKKQKTTVLSLDLTTYVPRLLPSPNLHLSNQTVAAEAEGDSSLSQIPDE